MHNHVARGSMKSQHIVSVANTSCHFTLFSQKNQSITETTIHTTNKNFRHEYTTKISHMNRGIPHLYFSFTTKGMKPFFIHKRKMQIYIKFKCKKKS